MKLKVSRKTTQQFDRLAQKLTNFNRCRKKGNPQNFVQFTMCNFECVKILDFYVSRLAAIAQKHKITLLLDSKGKSERVKMFKNDEN